MKSTTMNNKPASHSKASNASKAPAFSEAVPWKPDVRSKRDRENETNPENDQGMTVVHHSENGTLTSTTSTKNAGQSFNENEALDWEPLIHPILEDFESLQNLQSIYPIETMEGFRVRVNKVSWVLEEQDQKRPGRWAAKSYGATAVKQPDVVPSLISSWFPAGGSKKQ